METTPANPPRYYLAFDPEQNTAFEEVLTTTIKNLIAGGTEAGFLLYVSNTYSKCSVYVV